MTKQEWLKCINTYKMLNQITDDRKLRLFSCAVARQSWHLLDDKGKNAIITAEKFADKEATLKELLTARETVCSFPYNDENDIIWSALWTVAKNGAKNAINFTKQSQCNLLREITNPHHKPIPYPKVSIEIAQNIYKTQDFTGTPILADSLEENNVTDEELLNHLRMNTHVRGCWAVDVIRTQIRYKQMSG